MTRSRLEKEVLKEMLKEQIALHFGQRVAKQSPLERSHVSSTREDIEIENECSFHDKGKIRVPPCQDLVFAMSDPFTK